MTHNDPHTTKSSNEMNGDALTPLEISQAVLEGEENPNTARAITPLERAASGTSAKPERQRSALGRALHSPAVAWGGAALTGLGLIAALVYARRSPPSRWQALQALPSKVLPFKARAVKALPLKSQPLKALRSFKI
jgi:hypothetical protein